VAAAISDFRNSQILLSNGFGEGQDALPCLISSESVNLLWRGSGFLDFRTVPNFVKIGQSILEILQFFDFSRGPRVTVRQR